MRSDCCIRTQERQHSLTSKKIMKHIIFQEIISQLDSMSNQVLTTNEYGFTKKLSCETHSYFLQ